MPDVAVRIADDLKRGIGVHADDAPRTDREPRLLVHFAHDRRGDRLADLDGPAGQPPLPAVGALLEKQPAPPIEDDGGDARAHAERGR